MPLQSPVIDRPVPEVVEGEIFNQGPLTSPVKKTSRIEFMGSPARGNTFTSNHPLGIVLQMVTSSPVRGTIILLPLGLRPEVKRVERPIPG